MEGLEHIAGLIYASNVLTSDSLRKAQQKLADSYALAEVYCDDLTKRRAQEEAAERERQRVQAEEEHAASEKRRLQGLADADAKERAEEEERQAADEQEMLREVATGRPFGDRSR